MIADRLADGGRRDRRRRRTARTSRSASGSRPARPTARPRTSSSMLADAELYLEKAARRKSRRHERRSRGGPGRRVPGGDPRDHLGAHGPPRSERAARDHRGPGRGRSPGRPTATSTSSTRRPTSCAWPWAWASSAASTGSSWRAGMGVGGRVWADRPADRRRRTTTRGRALDPGSTGSAGSARSSASRSRPAARSSGSSASRPATRAVASTRPTSPGLSRFAQLASVALENARLHAAARAELAARTRTEEELRASTERLRRLADASFEALVIHRDGRILEVNTAFSELFGHAPDEIIGRPVTDLFPEVALAALTLQLNVDNEAPYETVALLADGSQAAGRAHRTDDPLPGRGPGARHRRSRHPRATRDPGATGPPVLLRHPDGAAEPVALPRPGDPRPGLGPAGRRDAARPSSCSTSTGSRSSTRASATPSATSSSRRSGAGWASALRPADTVARFGGDEFAVLVDGLAGEAAA